MYAVEILTLNSDPERLQVETRIVSVPAGTDNIYSEGYQRIVHPTPEAAETYLCMMRDFIYPQED